MSHCIPLARSVAVMALVALPLAAQNADPQMQKVDPQMQKVLNALQTVGAKPIHTMTPEQARNSPSFKDAVDAVLRQEGKPTAPEQLAKIEDRRIDGPGGPIALRIYWPTAETTLPGIVYYHGGGFVIADLDTYDASARALANAAHAVVVSSHYRQAPEHPFPASHDDAQAAFRFVVAHAAELHIDARRVAVAGESAGGNLATVVAMRQKRDGGAMPLFQLLVYPFVSNDVSTPSHQRNGQGNFILGNKDIQWFWRYELGPGWERNRDPWALPIYATIDQLRGLPPAFIVVGALDPLLDESARYAEKLKAAAVPVDVRRYDGVTHEFFGMGAVVDKAKQAEHDAAAALQKAFGAAK